MITPFFKLEQDNQFLTITIKVKYVKISDIEFYIEKNNFRFSLKPYYLNLNFSDSLKDSEKNSSKYDVETGILICKIEKETHGISFENLDLLSNLMIENSQNKKYLNKTNINKVEEIQGNIENLNIQNNKIGNNNINGNTSEDVFFECFQKAKKDFHNKNFNFNELNEIYFDFLTNLKNRKIFPESKLSNLNEDFSYGFNNQYKDDFSQRQEEMLEISDLNPEKIQVMHRFFEKMNIENNDFVAERYIGDFTLADENPEIFEANFQKYLTKQIKKNPLESLFTEKEQSTLISLNKIKLNLLEDESCIYVESLNSLNENQKNIYFMKSLNFNFYLQVIDLVFAYLYDFRINDFEPNSESGWNMNKLSSTLSCHLNYKNVFFSFNAEPPFNLIEELLKNLLISSYRRVLCYPLYRSFDLCNKIKKDLEYILENGKSYILKCLLNIRIALERSEPRFILNQIYTDQLIRWIQISNESIWKVILEKINTKDFIIDKDDLKLNLKEIEEDYI